MLRKKEKMIDMETIYEKLYHNVRSIRGFMEKHIPLAREMNLPDHLIWFIDEFGNDKSIRLYFGMNGEVLQKDATGIGYGYVTTKYIQMLYEWYHVCPLYHIKNNTTVFGDITKEHSV